MIQKQKATKESRGKNIEPVRQFAAANGVVRKKQVADALGITVEQARYAIETLVGQGHLRRIGLGSYEFVEQRRVDRGAPLEDKIWRAMRVNPTFSSSDVAIQAGTTKSYFYKRLREYRAEGFVKPAGVRQVPGGVEKLWRMTGKGREHLERPRVVEFRADPLVVKVVNLNKLICTGRAQRYEDARHEAQRLAAEIIADLGILRDRFVRVAKGVSAGTHGTRDEAGG